MDSPAAERPVTLPRTDARVRLSELHVDLTNYYELKHQGHQGQRWRLLADNRGGPAEREDQLAAPPPSCHTSSSSSAPPPCRADVSSPLVSPHHFLDGAPPKTAVFSGADGRLSDHHMNELYKER